MPSPRTKPFMTWPANLALIAALGVASGALESCARAPNLLPVSAISDSTKDYTTLSTKLAKDMTEKGVADAVGATPDKADLTTCTDHAGKQWQCRTWIFAGGKPKNNLRVVFYQADDGSWRVAAWDMF